MNYQIGIWSEELHSKLIEKDEKTSYVDSLSHDGPVFKFPQGRPAIGDVVCCVAHWDAVLRRGMREDGSPSRQVVRRVIRVKPAEVRGGETSLWLGPVAAKSLLLGGRGDLALRRDPKEPVSQPADFDLPLEFSTEWFTKGHE